LIWLKLFFAAVRFSWWQPALRCLDKPSVVWFKIGLVATGAFQALPQNDKGNLAVDLRTR
jgi:hypothetical protein